MRVPLLPWLRSWGSQMDLEEGFLSPHPLDLLSGVGRTLSGFYSPAYEELVEVVTRGVAKLNIDWQTERQEACQKSKVKEHFLPSPFSIHVFNTNVLNYSSIMGLKEHGYGVMPKVEEMLASYLSP